MLIVVSATVGANAVLGPKLWSPAGKVVLAMVFTMTSGLFGLGLIRWGAERGGWMILVATLMLVPINLMLAGEVRLVANGAPAIRAWARPNADSARRQAASATRQTLPSTVRAWRAMWKRSSPWTKRVGAAVVHRVDPRR